ncbi:hypothetical protein TSOC_009779 [Tetrabaena socialis]|uniref:Uncharacterized protein n=1 Tax=Tetrabaena socialis TaxID=47790 RepID=A0A2J7ZUZ1_9CHLO|nr:hypothetical protein TSOC_009779 [Tetrabaena socialis]|eukprot:PNH04091.1 hypothetical protein TSOC_009779 [Tetrabaena socialis]
MADNHGTPLRQQHPLSQQRPTASGQTTDQLIVNLLFDPRPPEPLEFLDTLEVQSGDASAGAGATPAAGAGAADAGAAAGESAAATHHQQASLDRPAEAQEAVPMVLSGTLLAPLAPIVHPPSSPTMPLGVPLPLPYHVMPEYAQQQQQQQQQQLQLLQRSLGAMGAPVPQQQLFQQHQHHQQQQQHHHQQQKQKHLQHPQQQYYPLGQHQPQPPPPHVPLAPHFSGFQPQFNLQQALPAPQQLLQAQLPPQQASPQQLQLLQQLLQSYPQMQPPLAPPPHMHPQQLPRAPQPQARLQPPLPQQQHIHAQQPPYHPHPQAQLQPLQPQDEWNRETAALLDAGRKHAGSRIGQRLQALSRMAAPARAALGLPTRWAGPPPMVAQPPGAGPGQGPGQGWGGGGAGAGADAGDGGGGEGGGGGGGGGSSFFVSAGHLEDSRNNPGGTMNGPKPQPIEPGVFCATQYLNRCAGCSKTYTFTKKTDKPSRNTCQSLGHSFWPVAMHQLAFAEAPADGARGTMKKFKHPTEPKETLQLWVPEEPAVVGWHVKPLQQGQGPQGQGQGPQQERQGQELPAEEEAQVAGLPPQPPQHRARRRRAAPQQHLALAGAAAATTAAAAAQGSGGQPTGTAVPGPFMALLSDSQELGAGAAGLAGSRTRAQPPGSSSAGVGGRDASGGGGSGSGGGGGGSWVGGVGAAARRPDEGAVEPRAKQQRGRPAAWQESCDRLLAFLRGTAAFPQLPAAAHPEPTPTSRDKAAEAAEAAGAAGDARILALLERWCALLYHTPQEHLTAMRMPNGQRLAHWLASPPTHLDFPEPEQPPADPDAPLPQAAAVGMVVVAEMAGRSSPQAAGGVDGAAPYGKGQARHDPPRRPDGSGGTDPGNFKRSEEFGTLLEAQTARDLEAPWSCYSCPRASRLTARRIRNHGETLTSASDVCGPRRGQLFSERPPITHTSAGAAVHASSAASWPTAPKHPPPYKSTLGGSLRITSLAGALRLTPARAGDGDPKATFHGAARNATQGDTSFSFKQNWY